MIHINVHEPQEIMDLLRAKSGEQSISIQNFTPGDYLIGNIAIERKTIGDFLGSLAQGRLFEQLQRLKSCYPVSFLLVEAFDLTHFQNPKAIYGALLHIMLEMNIKIIFTQSKEQTADVLLLLAGRKMAGRKNTAAENTEKTIQASAVHTNREKDAHAEVMRRKKQMQFHRRQREALESIPLVGKQKAKLLLEKFGSLQGVFTASRSELRKVPGIGRKAAANIKKMWEMRV